MATVVASLDVDCEFVFVDDDSPDDSWAVLQRLVRADDRVVALRLASNVRQTRAIFAGTEVAVGDAIVVMDSDLEDPPEFLPDLIHAFQAGHDLVVAQRARRRRPVGRELGSRALGLAARAAGLPISDVGSSFLIMSREVERGVRRELERNGTQLLLPTNFAVSTNPTTRTVTSPLSKPSHYGLRTLLHIGLEFLSIYVAPRLGQLLLRSGAAAGAIALGSAGVGRRWRPLAAMGAAQLLLGWSLSVSDRRDRRDRSEALYEVAERAGRIGSRPTQASGEPGPLPAAPTARRC